MTVQSASHHEIQVGSAENFDFLLRELHGAHLRLSFFVVRQNFQTVKPLLLSLSGFLFLSQEPPWSTEHRDLNGTVTYKGYIADIADYMARALNVT